MTTISSTPSDKEPPPPPRATQDGYPSGSGYPSSPSKSVPSPAPVRRRPRPVPSSVPIPKTEDNECTVWKVMLKKEDASEKYGFSYANRRDLNDDSIPANTPGIEALIVKGFMAQGLMLDWNIEHPDAEVCVGDRIVEVNGKTRIGEMKEALRADEINITIRRYPSVFHVELTKTELQERLGFKFERPSATNPNADSIALLRITEVATGGLMDEVNKANFSQGLPHFVVTAGMYIEAANDVAGSADAIADELRRSTTVRVRIRR